jgi:hypothetical protein
MTRPTARAVLGWSVYTASLEATRPETADRVPDPTTQAKMLAESLNWMEPSLVLTADRIAVRLSVHAPSAEAALAHVRGSLRSALHGAGVPAVGRWPLVSLSVLPAGETASPWTGTDGAP